MAYDILKEVDRLKAYSQSFVLSPKNWRSFKTTATLEWRSVPFLPGNRGQIPNERGLYAFVIEHLRPEFPTHGYVLYGGAN